MVGVLVVPSSLCSILVLLLSRRFWNRAGVVEDDNETFCLLELKVSAGTTDVMVDGQQMG